MSRLLLVGSALLCVIFVIFMFADLLAIPSYVFSVEANLFPYENRTNETSTTTALRVYVRESFVPTGNRSSAIDYVNRCITCDISDAIIESGTNILSFPFEVQVLPDCFQLRSFHSPHALLQEIFDKYGSLWVSYLGDSRLREPYVRLFELITGQSWRTRKADYQDDRYFCCFDSSDPSKCYTRRNPFQYDGSIAGLINKDFIEMSDSGEQRLRKGFCASWQWRHMPYEVSLSVRTYSQPSLALTPLAFVMNPGVHSVGTWWNKTVEYKNGLDILIRELLDAKGRKPELKIVFHGIDATVDEIFSRREDRHPFMMRWVDRFDTILKNRIRPWLGIMALHDTYRYTRFSKRTGSEDGMHWNGDYFNLLNYLDFNDILDDRCVEF